MNFAMQSLMSQKKAPAGLRQPIIGTAPRPKQHPARCGYGHRNADKNSDHDELQDEEPISRRSTALQNSEPAKDNRREYSGQKHSNTC